MNIPYRTRKVLRRLLTVLLVTALVAVIVWLIWLLWLDRYVVYSDEGARIDMSRSSEYISGELAVPPEAREPIGIYFNDGENAINTSTELTQVYGYYVDSTMLQQRDFEEILTAIRSMPKGTTLMLEVKNIYGEYYYSSKLGPHSEEVDIAAMDALISELRTSGIYTVAKVSAFRDYTYGLKNDTFGLPHIDGGYLWADEDYCYWLNPDSSGTLNYLINIIAELKGLGFNEVVFDNFCFPNTEDILYDGDKAASLTTAAATLAANGCSETFAVSFITDLTTFTLPEGRVRAYVDGVSASQAKSMAEGSGIADPQIHVVFVTEAKDTRYDEFGVLRPITSAKFE